MVDDDPDRRSARSLKTAASVLQVLHLLGGHPGGLSPHEVAAKLGKSPATARYMVNTLAEAGLRRARGARPVVPVRAPAVGVLGRGERRGPARGCSTRR